MIGTALKKYAELHALTCDGGYAYGRVNRRHIALLDGSGVKMLQIYLCPPDRADERMSDQVRAVLSAGAQKEYRLIRQGAVNVASGRAVVVFQDGLGAMKRIERYIDEILPRLDGLVPAGDACACCGFPIIEGAQYVLADDYVLPVHEGCLGEAPAMLERIGRTPREGSVLRGTIGAVLGALLGAIPWVILQLLGYVAGIAGLLIGLLSNLLYGKFGGRNTRARAAAVLTALVLGVLLGQTIGISAVYSSEFDEAGGIDATGLSRMEYVESCWDECLIRDQAEALSRRYDRMVENIPEAQRAALASREEFIQQAWEPEYGEFCAEARGELLTNLGMGVLFGLIGSSGMYSQINWRAHRRTVRKLK